MRDKICVRLKFFLCQFYLKSVQNLRIKLFWFDVAQPVNTGLSGRTFGRQFSNNLVEIENREVPTSKLFSNFQFPAKMSGRQIVCQKFRIVFKRLEQLVLVIPSFSQEC